MNSNFLKILFFITSLLGIIGYVAVGFARAFNLLPTLEIIEFYASSSATMVLSVLIYIFDKEG